MSTLKTVVSGIGGYLPQNIVSNHDLAEKVDTSDEWIQARTGIKQRHIAAEGEFTSHLATKAAQSALDNAGMNADEIDLIVVCTTTPDHTFPSVATMVQSNLGMTHGAAFDMQAVCAGFIYGIQVVDSMIKTGAAKNALLIGAETMSRVLDWEDRATCVLFGDGAGAVVLSAADENDNSKGKGLVSSFIRSDGRHKDLLFVDGGPSSTQTVGHLRMLGNQVFKYAVKDIAGAIEACAEQADVSVADIDWFVPHQANQRILNGVAKRLGIQESVVISTVSQHANTSAASVPLAFAHAVKEGKIKRGQSVMLEAFGGGFTWGAALLEY